MCCSPNRALHSVTGPCLCLLSNDFLSLCSVKHLYKKSKCECCAPWHGFVYTQGSRSLHWELWCCPQSLMQVSLQMTSLAAAWWIPLGPLAEKLLQEYFRDGEGNGWCGRLRAPGEAGLVLEGIKMFALLWDLRNKYNNRELWQWFRQEESLGLGSLRARQWDLLLPQRSCGCRGLVHHRVLSPQCRSAKWQKGSWSLQQKECEDRKGMEQWGRKGKTQKAHRKSKWGIFCLDIHCGNRQQPFWDWINPNTERDRSFEISLVLK